LTTRQNIQQQFDQLELLSAGMAGMVHAKEAAHRAPSFSMSICLKTR